MWPVYYCSKPLKAARIVLKKGQPFPLQSKPVIRGLGRAFGVENADKIPFGDLPYVSVLNVGTEEAARHLMERGLELDEAQKLLKEGRL